MMKVWTLIICIIIILVLLFQLPWTQKIIDLLETDLEKTAAQAQEEMEEPDFSASQMNQSQMQEAQIIQEAQQDDTTVLDEAEKVFNNDLKLLKNEPEKIENEVFSKKDIAS